MIKKPKLLIVDDEELIREAMPIRLIPNIQIVLELPQWIVSSEKGAYHPATSTIWIHRGSYPEMVAILIHELGHHAICLMMPSSKSLHRWWDRWVKTG